METLKDSPLKSAFRREPACKIEVHMSCRTRSKCIMASCFSSDARIISTSLLARKSVWSNHVGSIFSELENMKGSGSENEREQNCTLMFRRTKSRFDFENLMKRYWTTDSNHSIRYRSARAFQREVCKEIKTNSPQWPFISPVNTFALK